MKTGILTFHDAVNYGAVLQAQALYNVINSFENSQCEIIDYSCEAVDSMYQIKTIKSAKELIKIPYCLIKRQAFRNYLKKYCNLSTKVNKDTINSISKNFQTIIVGSDQVWNGSITGNDHSFLLDFCGEDTKKGSYAASIGNYSIPDEEIYAYRKLKDFYGLSAREPQGAKIISEITQKEVAVHIDPTLLVENSYWKNKATNPKINGKYIFIYASENAKKIIDAACQLREKTGYKIIFMGNYDIPNGKKVSFVTPDKWLGLIQNAEIVLTNSFHGTAFSTIFKKCFFVDLNRNEETRAIQNDRAGNLLQLFGLNNQVIENAGKLYSTTPNWETMDRELTNQRKIATEYLYSLCTK